MLFRRTAETEDLVALTALIRAAYAPHALKGLRYWATHQSVDDTARRLSRGVGFVGGVDGELIATITLSKPEQRVPSTLTARVPFEPPATRVP